MYFVLLGYLHSHSRIYPLSFLEMSFVHLRHVFRTSWKLIRTHQEISLVHLGNLLSAVLFRIPFVLLQNVLCPSWKTSQSSQKCHLSFLELSLVLLVIIFCPSQNYPLSFSEMSFALPKFALSPSQKSPQVIYPSRKCPFSYLLAPQNLLEISLTHF